MFKVYHIADRVHIAVRPSISIANFEQVSTWPIRFDSQHPYPHLLTSPVAPASDEEEAQLKRFAEELRRALGLSLFGFDVIREEGTGVYYVVDVNYFPSFKELGSELPRLLREYFISLVKQKRLQSCYNCPQSATTTGCEVLPD